MWPSNAEIQAVLNGLSRLLFHDPSGLAFFDRSWNGFWKSYAAAILCLPIWLALVLRFLPDVSLNILLAELAGYSLSWTVMPLVMVGMTEQLGVGRRYYDYAVTVNWMNLPYLSMVFVAVSLGDLGVVSVLLVPIMQILLELTMLYYLWYVTRTALQVDHIVAAGLVMLDFFISQFIHLFIALAEANEAALS